MKFSKMHGAGNDYIYVNCFEEKIENPEELSIWMSHRNFGIGSDGLILIMPSDKADFRMRMFNNDGSEGKMCGNGTRCVGKYVYDHGFTDKQEIIPFESVNRTEVTPGATNIVFDDGERLPLSEQEYLKFRLSFVDWRSNA